jgi:uncharacterized protein
MNMPTTLSAGVSLKPQHFDAALATREPGLWFEVHPENYMVDGGPRLSWLTAISEHHPISLHGVAMSLAGESALDAAHLARFASLVKRIAPRLVSEHLAWSNAGGAYLPDLLPLPRTNDALNRIVSNISQMQDAIGRVIAIENPSHYIRIEGHAWDEIAFLHEIAKRSGCGLLLDVNNVYVSAQNLGYSADAYIDAFPGDVIHEIHLAGHSADPTLGDSLLIDSHDAPVAPEVWALYRRLITRVGARPTLIERDDNLPSFDGLLQERSHAVRILDAQIETGATRTLSHTENALV